MVVHLYALICFQGLPILLLILFIIVIIFCYNIAIKCYTTFFIQCLSTLGVTGSFPNIMIIFILLFFFSNLQF